MIERTTRDAKAIAGFLSAASRSSRKHARRYFVRVFRYSRRARFTARALLNSAATSASSRIRFGPPANRFAYFPRIPPRKSYSGRRSSCARRVRAGRLAARALLAFFIVLPLPTGRESSTRTGVLERRRRLLEANAVLAQVASSFSWVPREMRRHRRTFAAHRPGSSSKHLLPYRLSAQA